MPELPEVQSTVNYLIPHLEGQSIISCLTLWGRTLATHGTKALNRRLSGCTISSVSRRGKFIVIGLERNSVSSALLIHLRMSGTVEVLSSSINRDPYDRFILLLSNERELRFNDVRKFGKIYYCENPQEILGKLGIEPLSEEFTAGKLSGLISKKKGAIKPLLLNQSVIAGIGNIYADESLWLAKIHPTRSAQTLKKGEITNLHKAIIEVLKEAISLNGTDNGDEVVEGGLYQPKVYGRKELDCSRCKSKIVRIVVGQRGTHFCKRCQPSRR